MSKVVISKEKVVAVADAVREKTGTSDGYSLDAMPDAIRSIQGGGGGADFEISDATHLFYGGARYGEYENYKPLLKNLTSMKEMYSNNKDILEADFNGIDTSKVTTIYGLFNNCSNLKSVDFSNFDGSSLQNASYLLTGCGNITEVDLSGLNTENATDFSNMFASCVKLENATLAGLNTKKITKMPYMFNGCSKLTEADLSGFETPSLTDISYMFNGCKLLKTSPIQNFDISNCSNFTNLFYNCESLTKLDFSNWDTANVSNMGSMFFGCKALEEITGFSATNKAGLTIGFPVGGSATSKFALKRLTFRTDLPEGTYSIRSAINIRYCSFDRDGMVEMFNTLPDINSANVSANYKKITITGNPCVTDGTLTDDDKAIATSKGWTLVI